MPGTCGVLWEKLSGDKVYLIGQSQSIAKKKKKKNTIADGVLKTLCSVGNSVSLSNEF